MTIEKNNNLLENDTHYTTSVQDFQVFVVTLVVDVVVGSV